MHRPILYKLLAILLLTACTFFKSAEAQQVPDESFQLHQFTPSFTWHKGPLVLIDESHNNASLIETTYRPFIQLLEKDGYRIRSLHISFTERSLAEANILVIINAVASQNVSKASLPVWPAFSETEILAVKKWVKGGGSLLLVADHMPYPEAANNLARTFGVEFMNGFAIDTVHWDPLIFKRRDGSLSEHPITNGRNDAERIDSVATFWGQAFRSQSEEVNSLFTFKNKHIISYNPDTAWRFNERTEIIPVHGWLQAAALQYGKGRVLILGEAGLLSAQLVGRKRIPMGMNAAVARQNGQFILNAFHWLSGLLPIR